MQTQLNVAALLFIFFVSPKAERGEKTSCVSPCWEFRTFQVLLLP